MRIVGPNRQEVQSLGRHSVGNTGLEGDAVKIAAITGVMVGLSKQAAEILDRRDQQQADLDVQKAEAIFQATYVGRDYISASELPDSLRGNFGENDIIPSAQILPQLYKQHLTETLKSASGRISLARSRTDWIANKNEIGSSRLNKLQVAANASLEGQILNQQKSDADKAEGVGAYGTAKELWRTMRVPESTRQDNIIRLEKAEEVGAYQNSLAEYKGDLTELRAASEFLGQEYDEYLSSGGKLSPLERDAAKHEIDRRIISESGKISKLDQKIKAQLDRDISLALSNPVSGKKSNFQTITDLIRRTIAANSLSGENYESELIRLHELFNVSKITDTLILGNRLEREDALRKGVTIQGYSPQQNRNLQNQLEAAHMAKTDAENTDLMGSARDAGIFPQGLVPIDFNAPPNVLYTQLMIRNEQHTDAKLRYGDGLGGGILAAEEAKALSQAFEKMSIQQQLNMLTSVSAAFGLEAGSLFLQQLASDGESSTLSNAGIALTNGYENNANIMLSGMKYRKNNPKEMKDFNANASDMMFTTISNMFVNKPVKRGTMKNTITDAYVGIAIQKGETLEVFDEDIYDEAVQMATGGIFEQGDYKLANPIYGMKAGVMEDWISDTNRLILDEQNGGGVSRRDLNSGVQVLESSKKTWERIQNGDYQMQGSDQTDEWIIVDQNGTPFKNKAGDTYRIKYDPSAEKGYEGLAGERVYESGTMRGRFSKPTGDPSDFNLPDLLPWNRDFEETVAPTGGRYPR